MRRGVRIVLWAGSVLHAIPYGTIACAGSTGSVARLEAPLAQAKVLMLEPLPERWRRQTATTVVAPSCFEDAADAVGDILARVASLPRYSGDLLGG